MDTNFHLNVTALVGIWSECCDYGWTKYWFYISSRRKAIGISGTAKNNIRKQGRISCFKNTAFST